MSYVPRPAVPGDIDAIFTIVNEAYMVEHGNTGVAFKDGTRFASISEVKSDEYLILEDVSGAGSEIVGVTRVVLLVGDGPCFLPPGPAADAVSKGFSRNGVPTASFGPFAVAKSKQGKGIASILLKCVEDYARATLGAEQIEIITINWRTDVQPFYLKRGYSFVYATAPPVKFKFPFTPTRPIAAYIFRKTIVDKK